MTYSDDRLWCVHVIGPDELHACATAGDAIVWAHELNGCMRHHMDRDWTSHSVISWAVPTIWPYDAASHAEDLIRQQKERLDHFARRIGAHSGSAAAKDAGRAS